jgi:putative IMPACT (imprinted ancient) family translation regulator
VRFRVHGLTRYDWAVATKIRTRSECVVTVKRSRFDAVVVPASSVDDVKAEVDRRRKTHRKARHHCWSCRVHDGSGGWVEQARDDGEVGKPGMALLELLRRYDLEGGIIVSRFFGGVKLGPAGVARAVREAAREALEAVGS